MNSNDNLNNKNKQSNIRLRHMFQASEDDANNGVYIPQTLDNEKLNKISLKFESSATNQISILDSVKQMMDLSESDPTKSLLDYIDQLKSAYKPEEVIEDEEVDEELQLDYTEDMDIDEIISESEKDLLNNKNQKSMLFDLINDINSSSSNKTSYNDEDFERNISEIINSKDDDVDRINDIQKTEDNNKEQVKEESIQPKDVKKKKKSKKRKKGKILKIFLALLLFVIMGLTIMFYLDNEQFFEIYNEVLKIYDQVSELIRSKLSNLNI